MCNIFAECFVESIPQFHLTWILVFITGSENAVDLLIFILSFPLSLVSASLGMSRILMNGPSKLIKKSKSCSGWVFVLLNLSFICVIISKSTWIGEISTLMDSSSGIEPTELAIILIWICTSFIPQCLLVRKRSALKKF